MKKIAMLALLCATGSAFARYGMIMTWFENKTTDRIYRYKGNEYGPGAHASTNYTVGSTSENWAYHEWQQFAELVARKRKNKKFYFSDSGQSWIENMNYYSRDYKKDSEDFNWLNDPGSKRTHGNLRIRINDAVAANCYTVTLDFDSGGNKKDFTIGPAGWGLGEYNLYFHVKVYDGSFDVSYGDKTRGDCSGWAK
ncbi:hypothetical protein JW872_03430 [Candidatus Babeliales bacterium]|nr:hypothetical protein [Candidatus Babeliales bacterium]